MEKSLYAAPMGLATLDDNPEDAIEIAREVFIVRGARVDDEGQRDESLDTLSKRGGDLMKQLHGDRATQGYAAPGNDITGALYPLAIQYGYGEIWFRPGLERRQRALVAVAGFTALRLPEQVGKFGQSALNVGLSKTEVIEAIMAHNAEALGIERKKDVDFAITCSECITGMVVATALMGSR